MLVVVVVNSTTMVELSGQWTLTWAGLPAYLLMDFCQTLVIGASWDKDELIRFWSQSSKVKVNFRGGNVQHSTLP